VVDVAPRLVARDQMVKAAGAAFGGGRRLEAVERLAGGTRKGVYRLRMDDATTAIAYVWEDDENYWPAAEGDNDHADPFCAGEGLYLFEAAHTRLESIGLRVPIIYLIDRDHSHYPAELAIVEDFPGEDLEQLYERDRPAARLLIPRVAEVLEALRGCRAPRFGKVAWIDEGRSSHGTSCEAAALDFALRCLREAAARDQRLEHARDRVEERLRELAAAIRPRAEYSLVHNELWGHVLMDRAGRPVLIDIEDLMYFDVEWEHVFLTIRLYPEEYTLLAVDGLDEDRLALYTLAQHLSLTAGPLRLLDGDYPNREFMQEIAEYNMNQALALASAG
jgi:Phosphotransferase enzyme family